MDSLFFWVWIENIPPAMDVKQTIINVASVAGQFLDIDKKLFDNTGRIRFESPMRSQGLSSKRKP
ncbi:hypothetical protein RchiOBHm_Chr1g0354791 [Rosa chinensis]|uniref:Uncharacterized protein n=1 Tax=Rosa chinensis TaxID=74649 RepID=A0A2P6SH77_ROSCH|nr:hypothetical protein RchiOBHm_Chr1g0354791 [Rosa chinensis]